MHSYNSYKLVSLGAKRIQIGFKTAQKNASHICIRRANVSRKEAEVLSNEPETMKRRFYNERTQKVLSNYPEMVQLRKND